MHTRSEVMENRGTATIQQPAEEMMSQTSRTEPLYQYADLVPPGVQAAAPMYPPQNQILYPNNSPTLGATALNAGVTGLIVVGTGSLGANLHRVEAGEMTMADAVTDSLVKGAAGGVAAAGATAAASALTGGGVLGLAVTLAVGTGVSYLLNK